VRYDLALTGSSSKSLGALRFPDLVDMMGA
jgi:hypothetical protein